MNTTERALPEESYEELWENAPCGFLSVTLDGIVLRVNQTLLDWTGHLRDELVGSAIVSMLSPASRIFYETRFVPVLRLEGRAREVSMELTRADGRVLNVLTNSTIARATSGEAEFARIAVFDSTERHNYERELVIARRQAETSEARVRVLQDAATAFALAQTAGDVANALVDSAKDAFSATEASVMLFRGPVELYVAAGVHPLLQYLPPDTLDYGSEAIRNNDMFVVSSVEQGAAYSPGVGEAMKIARIEAITATPIESETGLFGVLHCAFGRSREFDSAYRLLNRALARQASQVIARIELQDQLAREALHDQLTGLANRTLLQDRMDSAIGGAQRSGIPLAVLFVDLDGFKGVNDHLGHVIGDAALREVSDRLREHVRATDVVGRFGGDEFVIVCPDTDQEASMVVAERIRAAIAASIDKVPSPYGVTASIGIALWHPTDVGIDADTLFRIADEAMYRCKNAGKDCVALVRV
jgi:diguanylate cyclase (GGDEF)-like protein/PAS domain S-box-containing protein